MVYFEIDGRILVGIETWSIESETFPSTWGSRSHWILKERKSSEKSNGQSFGNTKKKKRKKKNMIELIFFLVAGYGAV